MHKIKLTVHNFNLIFFENELTAPGIKSSAAASCFLQLQQPSLMARPFPSIRSSRNVREKERSLCQGSSSRSFSFPSESLTFPAAVTEATASHPKKALVPTLSTPPRSISRRALH